MSRCPSTLTALLLATSLQFSGSLLAGDLPPPGPAEAATDQALLLLPGETGAPALDPAIVAAFGGAADAYGAKDFGPARAAWANLAKDGFGPAQYNLGVMLEQGRGGGVDYAAAANWYRRAAEQDVAPAMINLARLHFEGRGVKRDASEGLRWLEMAAMLNAPQAAYNLGVARLKGLGGKPDPRQAAHWFERAVAAGHGPAAYNLAVLYRDGSGVKRDPAKAERLFGRAAKTGDPFAHYALADLLLRSASPDAKRQARALKYLKTAAAAGVTVAQNRLAIMLAKGEGAKRDPETALMWFHVAAGLGAANAAKNRDALARTLPEAMRARAKRRADSFQPSPPP